MQVKLPSDLEEEIYNRVPCKSLARFRCVCKLWNSLSHEYRFLRKNLSRMHSYSSQHQFIMLSHHGADISFVGLNEQRNMVMEDLTLTLKVRPVVYPINPYKVVHCDGLLLCVLDKRLLVWNPLLKETSWINCGRGFYKHDDAYSLGYLNSDYKILRFRCGGNSRGMPPRVEVCEVSSKTWKVIDLISFDWVLKLPLSILSLKGTPYCIGLRVDYTAFVQSFDFSKERFQPVDDLPFKYDEFNPLALEIFRGDLISVLEQCHKTRKICIWVKHCLMIPSPWSILMAVAIPNFPLLYQPSSHYSSNYFIGQDGKLVVTFMGVGTRGQTLNNICRVVNGNEFKIFGPTDLCGNFSACNYVPGLFRLPGFSKEDPSQILRWRAPLF